MKSRQQRVDGEFANIMRDIMDDRVGKKLCLPNMRDRGLPEGTRLLLRCPAWSVIQQQLRTMPKGKGR